jgi:HEPN domain-containing protein
MPTEEDDRIAPPGPPRSFLAVAQQLMHGVRILAIHGDAAAKVIPLCMLCAHALECVLKALLSAHGTLRGDLRKSHDISKLWGAAAKEGWSFPMPDWGKDLSGLHAHPYHLRYLERVHGIVTPAAQPMADELGEMIEAAEEKLRGIP